MNTGTPDIVLLFAEPDQKNRKLRDLALRIRAIGRSRSGPLAGRLDALESLVAWLKVKDASVPLPVGESASVGPEWRRLLVLAALLDQQPGLVSLLRESFARVLAETHGLPLFAEAGLPNDRGILGETSDRLARRLLPKPRDEHDLSRLLERLLPRERDVEWLDLMPPDMFARLADQICDDEGDLEFIVNAMSDALALLAGRVQTLGLSEAMRERRTPARLRLSPYFRLPRSADALLDGLHVPALALDCEREFRADVDGCRAGIEEVLTRLETTGVSVDVVYSLDVMGRALDRMEALLSVLKATPGVERAAATHRLLVMLAHARLNDRSLRQLARENLRLLSRKLIERAGQTGEHYITVTRGEWFAMLVSGGGGGVITAGTAALKLAITGAHFPPFVEGFLAGTNYAASFMLILFLGFTLATKQPSMTGAALAGVLRETSGQGREDDLATLVARIVRSQLAAAAGNVVVVAVVATAFDWVWKWRTGAPFVAPEKADHILEGMHPLRSGLVFYAALTGVILWLSSLAGGWAENFAVYRRLPQAIAEHPLGRWIGTPAMARASRLFASNLSGYAGSIALGFMLAMTPVVGRFFGLPLDVRHVTLSTGTVVLAASSLGRVALLDHRLHMALVGIVLTFILNLGVSFSLALWVAIRARDVSAHDRWLIVRAVGRRFARTPSQFFFPPRTSTPEGSYRQ